MGIFDAILLGIVEGITEFLPISSTGHLILVSELLRIPNDNFLKSFEISIQLGAILAVVVTYWRSFLNIEILKKILTAFLPTAIIGFVLYSFIKAFLIGNSAVVVAALLLGGILLIVFEKFYKENREEKEIEDITYKQAVVIGLVQSVAVIPGVSRSAATVIGGLSLGIPRAVIVKFSFLLAVPTMLAATTFDIYKNYQQFDSSSFYLLGIGALVAFIVALFTVRFLLKFVRNHSFVAFGVYRIVVALLFWIFILN